MKSLKTFGYWLGCCLTSASSVSIVVWLLYKMNILEIPPIFIFYFGIIDGTVTVLFKALLTAMDNFLKKHEGE